MKLRHPNVIHILKVSRDAAPPHFIMEFFPSGSHADAADGRRTSTFIKETRAEDLQAGGDGPGLHERQRLGPPRREAGQHAGERGRRAQDHRLRHLAADPQGAGASCSIGRAKAAGDAELHGARSRSASRPSTPGPTSTASGATCYELIDRPAAVPRATRFPTCLTKHLTEKPVTPAVAQPGRDGRVRGAGPARCWRRRRKTGRRLPRGADRPAEDEGLQESDPDPMDEGGMGMMM